jgi:hypothetical protein
MITLSPPDGMAPFKSIKLHSGATVFPDFQNGGHAKVPEEEEARELEAWGWRRDATSAKAAKFDADMLRKAAASQLRRMPGTGDFETTSRNNSMQMAEFNVAIGGEKIRVKRGDRAITIAGVELPTDDLPIGVRRELEVATARLDGASFDIDGDLIGLQEARRAIEAAIASVVASRPFRDRLIAAGTRRVKEG